MDVELAKMSAVELKEEIDEEIDEEIEDIAGMDAILARYFCMRDCAVSVGVR